MFCLFFLPMGLQWELCMKALITYEIGKSELSTALECFRKYNIRITSITTTNQSQILTLP